MEIYKLSMNVDIHDVDFNGVAKTSSILRYIQSAAQFNRQNNSSQFVHFSYNTG